MKILKTVFSLISGIILAAAMTVSASAYNITVRDDADFFTDEEEAQIIGKAESVSEKGGWNVLILTAEGDVGKPVVRFADDSYEAENGVNASGVCIVLNSDNPDTSEPDVYLGTYGSAIELITDSRIESFLDDCFYYYDNYEEAQCVLTGLDSLSRFIEEGPDNSTSIGSLVMGVIFGLVIAAITCGCIASSYKFHGTVSANAYLDSNSVNMYRKTDMFMRETHTRRKIESSSGGGGSSTHRTSGGGSAGGGGRSSSHR